MRDGCLASSSSPSLSTSHLVHESVSDHIDRDAGCGMQSWGGEVDNCPIKRLEEERGGSGVRSEAGQELQSVLQAFS